MGDDVDDDENDEDEMGDAFPSDDSSFYRPFLPSPRPRPSFLPIKSSNDGISDQLGR